MDSFQPSRGKLVFQSLCALMLAASLAVAWRQTGAAALLAASAAAALFGVSHAFGARRYETLAVAELQSTDPGSADCGVADAGAVAPSQGEELPIVEIESTPAKKSKTPRKPRSRRTAPEVPVTVEPESAEDLRNEQPVSFGEADHHRIEPLFEPEPFVRQPRAVVFGRKAIFGSRA